jgi:hypothetical protein
VTGPGYWGVSMGTAIGVPLPGTSPRYPWPLATT